MTVGILAFLHDTQAFFIEQVLSPLISPRFAANLSAETRLGDDYHRYW